MAYRVHHTNKKTGITYVYNAVSHWDKERKQSRNKQVCIGKLDPYTLEFIPSKRLNHKQSAVMDPQVTACRTQIVGTSIILDSISERLGLRKLLKKCFPTKYSISHNSPHHKNALSTASRKESHCEIFFLILFFKGNHSCSILLKSGEYVGR